MSQYHLLPFLGPDVCLLPLKYSECGLILRKVLSGAYLALLKQSIALLQAPVSSLCHFTLICHVFLSDLCDHSVSPELVPISRPYPVAWTSELILSLPAQQGKSGHSF